MSDLFFNADDLTDRLRRLSKTHVLAFGILQLERMIPNFIKFCIETQSEGVSLIKCVSSYAWRVLETGRPFPVGHIDREDINKIAPDTELYSSIYTSSALDAVTSSAKLIEFISRKDTSLIAEMSSLAVDSIDIYIQIRFIGETHLDNLEKLIRLHPIMQNELRSQLDDLVFLEGIQKEDSELFSAVLQRSITEAYSKDGLFGLAK